MPCKVLLLLHHNHHCSMEWVLCNFLSWSVMSFDAVLFEGADASESRSAAASNSEAGCHLPDVRDVFSRATGCQSLCSNLCSSLGRQEKPVFFYKITAHVLSLIRCLLIWSDRLLRTSFCTQLRLGTNC